MTVIHRVALVVDYSFVDCDAAEFAGGHYQKERR